MEIDYSDLPFRVDHRFVTVTTRTKADVIRGTLPNLNVMHITEATLCTLKYLEVTQADRFYIIKCVSRCQFAPLV